MKSNNNRSAIKDFLKFLAFIQLFTFSLIFICSFFIDTSVKEAINVMGITFAASLSTPVLLKAFEWWMEL